MSTPISLSTYLGIAPEIFIDNEVFDPILNIDSRLFIDPHLVESNTIPELSCSYEKIKQRFENIKILLQESSEINDIWWKKADSLMKWNEVGVVKGLCIGYPSKGTSGNGTGKLIRVRLLKTAKEIISKGIFNPKLFELVGLLEEGFGADRISDMIASIIKDDLILFTKNVFERLNVNIKNFFEIESRHRLPINPFNKNALLLVPKCILRDLPVALDWNNLDVIAEHNSELREKVNNLIGKTWKEATQNCKKSILKDVSLENPELINDLIQCYSSKPAQLYDFDKDRAGEYFWYPAARSYTKNFPLKISLPEHPNVEQVNNVVFNICNKFKDLIENNGLNELLYDRDKKVRREQAAQLLFFAISEMYCESNNIMIARESNSGRGPVDFKFGSNMENSILVEIKKSTNTSGLKKGIELQLPEYMKSERSKRAIYLVIDVGYTKAALETLHAINEKINGTAISIIHVDGSLKESASKFKKIVNRG